MGLDVSAFANMQLMKPFSRDDNGKIEWDEELCDADNVRSVYEAYPGMDTRLDGREQGYYRIPADAARVHGFRTAPSWSYSGYNRWRESISLLGMGVTPDEVWGNPDQYEGKPFYELVHFADNEGSIGPVTSAKLAHDFQSHRHQIKNWDAHSTNAYDLMQKCFEVASDNGFVIFH